MASTPALDHIPTEISERISEHLDLADLLSLRLTSRRVRSAASQKSFIKHFERKIKSFSNTSSLQRLSASLTQSGHARKLQHLDFRLTEDEPMNPTDLATIAIEQAVTALLCTLRKHLAEGCLQRLSIRLQDTGELRDWERAWEVVAGGVEGADALACCEWVGY
ncbi:hypothetical protein CLAFUW4_12705 [Fulvia fulva]|uniref:F-box domain-containing protein n=1 Tax=Passalora fulva TaxID=5499 RepID=A0A9Q8PJD4_PASFU|nr:uncharacterized protein CLAFUR5_12570 [Fulvia fulva]KAK4612268.1 hypothetical protein CLAFUR4_12710 [Fulvia fulva]KAK4613187.1 hypothetical protein CLAFUR0_12716 [Fulvia fulva]UJO23477.1 hypothetical protein CLAFUR5_12570 [Fulvia fulva]WPV21608.1 hypothetical protein CLAFUW4_12705 [Fulvia fulva]WPV36551.1 hypothetical protein CLAFUW7_12712 [Fulvia fulva]